MTTVDLKAVFNYYAKITFDIIFNEIFNGNHTIEFTYSDVWQMKDGVDYNLTKCYQYWRNKPKTIKGKIRGWSYGSTSDSFDISVFFYNIGEQRPKQKIGPRRYDLDANYPVYFYGELTPDTLKCIKAAMIKKSTNQFDL